MTYSWENLTVYRTGIVSKIKFWIKKVKFLRFNEGPFKVEEIPSALQQELPDLENVEIFIIFLVSEPFWPSWIQILNRSRIHCTDITGCGPNCGLFFYKQTFLMNTNTGWMPYGCLALLAF
jgi:hypothetical protein